MANLIQSAKAQVSQLTAQAYEAAVAAGALPAGVELKGSVEIPKDTAERRLSTTSVAMAGGQGHEHGPPRHCPGPGGPHGPDRHLSSTSVEIAGPGFLNFRLGDKWYADVLAAVENEKARTTARATRADGARSAWWSSSPPTPPAPCTWATPAAACWAIPWPTSSACGAAADLEGVLRQRRRQPDRQVRPLHRGPLPPAHQGRGRHRLPGGRLPRRRHQGTGPGLLRRARRQLCWTQTEQEPSRRPGRTSASGRNIPKMKADLRALRHRVRRVVLRVLPARERLCGRDGRPADRKGLDL